MLWNTDPGIGSFLGTSLAAGATGALMGAGAGTGIGIGALSYLFSIPVHHIINSTFPKKEESLKLIAKIFASSLGILAAAMLLSSLNWTLGSSFTFYMISNLISLPFYIFFYLLILDIGFLGNQNFPLSR